MGNAESLRGINDCTHKQKPETTAVEKKKTGIS